ncbi:MAG: carbamoyl transferase [Bacteroidota bacterium]|nr:carbamoyl transferase [Bacteroidota bacterium]
MKILGFNCYGHDSSATLIIDNKVVFAVEEERLTRKKHDGRLPVESIKACLNFANIKLSDIDHVTFFWKPSISYAKIPVFLLKYWYRIPGLLKEQRSFTVEENLGMLNYLGDMKKLPKTLAALFPEEKMKFEFHMIEHHFCHAASTFFSSPHTDSAIMTIDGAGEWSTCLMAHGKGNIIRKIGTVDTPHSLGAFYQAVSRHLGFKLIEGPGKLMGLSSYGNADSPLYLKMKKLITLLPDGGFELDMSFFSYHYTRKSGVSQKFQDMFGPSKKEGRDWSDHELDVAAAVQHVVEDVFVHMATHLQKVTGSENLCIAGGVGLNSVANGVIASKGIFKNMFIQPAAGDSGTSLGSAMYLNHCMLDRKREYTMETAFLGPSYPELDYEQAIKKYKLPYVKTSAHYAEFAAKKLAEGKILGWFQGRLEFGPRALGNRSIIANPLVAEMKTILNARVKFREGFRPFAAIVLEEDCGKYFDNPYPNPYMLMVYNVRPEYLGKLPAITHVDKSVRIQTVNKTENPHMRDLLEAFRKETGYSVLINTSFNIKGEPIVANPDDAVRSFAEADMDYLVIGNFIVAKPGDEKSLDGL